MRLFTALLLFITCNCFAQNAFKSDLKSVNDNFYFAISEKENSKLLIFLHGGISNPYFNQDINKIAFNYIIENNNSFIEKAEENEYDVILPIKNDTHNWLKEPNESFKILKEIINTTNKKYSQIILSGHSDGGTGSLKIFYSNPDFFSGLVIFNGYPQHNSFYKNADYKSITTKPIVFYSTLDDEIIPYEFLLTEYCQQKKSNPNTFLYLGEGDHNFSNYSANDFTQLFSILNGDIQNENTEETPIHGFVKNDSLITFYPFRKKITRKFGYGKIFLKENKKQSKNYKQ